MVLPSAVDALDVNRGAGTTVAVETTVVWPPCELVVDETEDVTVVSEAIMTLDVGVVVADVVLVAAVLVGVVNVDVADVAVDSVAEVPVDAAEAEAAFLHKSAVPWPFINATRMFWPVRPWQAFDTEDCRELSALRHD